MIVLCVATVPLFGGRLARLSDLRFRRGWAAVAAVVLQVLIMSVFPEGDERVQNALHLASYGLLFYFLAANLAIPGMWLIGLGGGCNAAAIAANDGVMPAQPSALATAGIPQLPGEFANSAAVPDPKLWFLGDIFAIPQSLPLHNVFSVGDILLVIGGAILLHRVSRSTLNPRLLRISAFLTRHGPQVGLLRDNRAFRRLWIAQGISAIGDWVYPLAVFTAVVNDDTQTASLAFLLLASVGPGVVVGIFGGPIIDRFSRKWMMAASEVGRGLAVASLLFVGEPSLGHLYAVAVCLGVGGALFTPAFQACLPNILKAPQLASGNALIGGTLSLAVMVGPLLGALIVQEFGITWGFTANAASFLFSGALVAGTVMSEPRAVVQKHAKSLLRELAVGMAYVRRTQEVRAVVVVCGLLMLAAGMKATLEPLFILRTLDAGPAGLGLSGTIWGVGMIAGSLVASAADRRLGHGPLLTLSVGVVAVAVLMAAGSPALGPVLILWLLAGAANALGTVAYETLLQESTPDELRGRVMAAVEASLQGGLLLGVGAAGAADAIFGDRPSRPGMFLCGVVFLAAALLAWRMLRRPAAPPAAAPVAAPALERLELVPAGTSYALLRVVVAEADEAPVLLVDDGARVHRLEPLPGGDGTRGFGYGVPRALLAGLRRPALALELRGRGLLDLPLPRGA